MFTEEKYEVEMKKLYSIDSASRTSIRLTSVKKLLSQGFFITKFQCFVISFISSSLLKVNDKNRGKFNFRFDPFSSNIFVAVILERMRLGL